MLTVANEYCHYLDHVENKSLDGILEFIYRILPLMYLKGSLMPEIVAEFPEANERFVTEENWEVVFNMLRTKFGAKDEFWLIDPLHINETEPLKASIAEHLSDIYQDMKDFILLFQRNTHAARENAIAEIRTLFGNHWGYKIAQITTQVHHLIHDSDTDISTSPEDLNFF